MLTIAWQYLTGKSVSSTFTNRQIPEWPVHPDRVFQALVAAWAERGKVEDEKSALLWLERLGPPELIVPEVECSGGGQRVFVPVNDLQPSEAQIQKAEYGDPLRDLLPEERPRKDRFFPYVRVGDALCGLVWADEDAKEHTESLSRLCQAVNRIGHSSSLVRCWLADSDRKPNYEPTQKGAFKDLMMRVPEPGRLKALCDAYDRSLESGTIHHASAARQFGYRRTALLSSRAHGHFGTRLMVFAQRDGQRFDLRQTLDITNALRGLMIKGAETMGAKAGLAKAMISGHESDGTPLRKPHLAFLPLGYVGSTYADGHIMGLALALPHVTTGEDEYLVYGSLARYMTEDGSFQLNLGRKGMGIFSFSEAPISEALKEQTWTKPSRVWASVTPIVMNHAVKNQMNNLHEWAADQVRLSCEHQDLPVPVNIKISAVPFVQGSFPCYMRNTPTSTFFPRFVHKQGMEPFMFHTWMEFPVVVEGPLLLGSGRYRGYGLCKPLEG